MPRTGAIEYAEPRGDKAYVRTTPCVVCGKQHEFILDNEAYANWQYGEYIQNSFPDLSAADREILISGTCDECFDQLFPPSPED